MDGDGKVKVHGGPAAKALTTARPHDGGADKFGRQMTLQTRGNRQHNNHHQQEHQRHSDIGRGCSNSDSGGKGEGVVAAASAAVAAAATAAMAATTTTVIAAEWARTAAMAAANAMVMAAVTVVAVAMLAAAAKAVLKWLLWSSEAEVGLSSTTVAVRRCRSMVVVVMVSLPWQE